MLLAEDGERVMGIRVQLPYIKVQRFQGGRVCKADRLLYHSTLGLRVIKKKKKFKFFRVSGSGFGFRV